MMKRLLTAGIALLLTASAAFAQAGAPPVPTPEALEWMCHTEGAGGFRFGQVGVPGTTSLEGALVYSGLALPDFARPFRSGDPSATGWSNRLREVYFYAASPDDPGMADAQVKAVGNALERMGWSSILPMRNGPNEPTYAMDYSEGLVFEKPADGLAGRTRVLLNVRHDHELGGLTLICGREDLLRVGDEENFGHLGHGTPRPLMPELDIPQVSAPADCDQPKIRASITRLLALGTDGRSMAIPPDRYILAKMVARTAYWDRLSTWMLWKIEESNKLSLEQFRALEIKAGILEQRGRDFYEENIFPLMIDFVDAAKAGDRQAVCRSLIPFLPVLARGDEVMRDETLPTRKLLESEAKRLGVSLD
jgi:hypothetical protein